MFELGPAADDMKRLVSGVSDDQLGNRTPCTEWTVSELLAHIHQFTTVFACNARKQPARPPDGLVDDWRQAIPDDLDDLATAWREESAWDGQVSAGGIEMNAPDNAVVHRRVDRPRLGPRPRHQPERADRRRASGPP